MKYTKNLILIRLAELRDVRDSSRCHIKIYVHKISIPSVHHLHWCMPDNGALWNQEGVERSNVMLDPFPQTLPVHFENFQKGFPLHRRPGAQLMRNRVKLHHNRCNMRLGIVILKWDDMSPSLHEWNTMFPDLIMVSYAVQMNINYITKGVCPRALIPPYTITPPQPNVIRWITHGSV